jgi:uncharacterized OB-fold protein
MTREGAARDWTQGEATIAYQRCKGCGGVWYFRRDFCPRCGAREPATLQSSGRGSIYARTLVHRAPSEALRPRVPYLIALVDMEEGFRMMGQADAGLAIGERVQARFERFGETLVPYFHKRKE